MRPGRRRQEHEDSGGSPSLSGVQELVRSPANAWGPFFFPRVADWEHPQVPQGQRLTFIRT